MSVVMTRHTGHDQEQQGVTGGRGERLWDGVGGGVWGEWNAGVQVCCDERCPFTRGEVCRG
jgi:hypothetical protein